MTAADAPAVRTRATAALCIEGRRYAPGDPLLIPDWYVAAWLRRRYLADLNDAEAG